MTSARAKNEKANRLKNRHRDAGNGNNRYHWFGNVDWLTTSGRRTKWCVYFYGDNRWNVNIPLFSESLKKSYSKKPNALRATVPVIMTIMVRRRVPNAMGLAKKFDWLILNKSVKRTMSNKSTKRANQSQERRAVRRVLNGAGEDTPPTLGNRIYKTKYGSGPNRRSFQSKTKDTSWVMKHESKN